MNFLFTELSREDDLYRPKNHKQKLKQIYESMKDISRNPHECIGKPEPLIFSYPGLWSRRIEDENRLIYRVIDDEVEIAKCRHH